MVLITLQTFTYTMCQRYSLLYTSYTHRYIMLMIHHTTHTTTYIMPRILPTILQTLYRSTDLLHMEDISTPRQLCTLHTLQIWAGCLTSYVWDYVLQDSNASWTFTHTIIPRILPTIYTHTYIMLRIFPHSEKSPVRPMLFYSTNYWHQFWVQFVA